MHSILLNYLWFVLIILLKKNYFSLFTRYNQLISHNYYLYMIMSLPQLAPYNYHVYNAYNYQFTVLWLYLQFPQHFIIRIFMTSIININVVLPLINTLCSLRPEKPAKRSASRRPDDRIQWISVGSGSALWGSLLLRWHTHQWEIHSHGGSLYSRVCFYRSLFLMGVRW